MANLHNYIGQKCQNCGAILQGKYCHICSQKFYFEDYTFTWSVRVWFQKKFDIIEGVAWNTAKDFLMKPGCITKSFVEGKRIRYVDPVKFLLFMAFLFTFLIQTNHISFLSIEINKIDSSQSLLPQNGKTLKSAESSSDFLPNNYQSTLNFGIQKTGKCQDRFDTTIDTFLREKELTLKSSTQHISKRPELISNVFSIVRQVYFDSCFINREMMNSINYFLWLMIPIFSLVLWKLHYRRKKGYLIHILHSLHLHSFGFLIGFLVILGFIVTNLLSQQAIIFSLLIIFIYFTLSIKNVYELGWIRSIVESILLAGFYITTLITIFVIYWMVFWFQGWQNIPFGQIATSIGLIATIVFMAWTVFMIIKTKRFKH